ncbi:TM2 domain-containing protein [Akkermansiaceae bacterium]|nr:TM2 domain-containing protein [Akkermansiaceae bacterium]
MSEESQNSADASPSQSPQQQVPMGNPAEKKLLAGILGILLGSLGIHKFVLGYNTAGIIMLVITVVTCGFGGMVIGLIGIIEGIIYLTKSDEEFVRTYVANKKEWF